MGKKASQSSLHACCESPTPFYAKYGNDGNRNGDYRKCAITKDDNAPFPWWKVDLGKSALVLTVAVKSGSTWEQTRINPFNIRVGDDEKDGGRSNPYCAEEVSLPGGEMVNFKCPKFTYGRFVSILINRSTNLQVCEAEVYGII